MVRLHGRAWDRHQRQSNARIATPEPVGGLLVSAPTSESFGHRYRDGLISSRRGESLRQAGGEVREANENHRNPPTPPRFSFTAPWKGARCQRQPSATDLAKSSSSRALQGRSPDSVIVSRSRYGGSRSPSLASPPANLSRASGSTLKNLRALPISAVLLLGPTGQFIA